jgi:hypothetical protein
MQKKLHKMIFGALREHYLKLLMQSLDIGL